jgi:hypothetical protein
VLTPVAAGSAYLRRMRAALKDLALRAENTPPDVAPVLTLKRLYVQAGYLPFFRHTVRIRDFALDGPAVHLERLAAGEVPLPRHARRAAPPAPKLKGVCPCSCKARMSTALLRLLPYQPSSLKPVTSTVVTNRPSER